MKGIAIAVAIAAAIAIGTGKMAVVKGDKMKGDKI